jgi:[CysO sulfur-carrier protein]-S-L-cysteine hydrolase
VDEQVMRAVAIPAALLARIYQHARAAFPDECCGYLAGAGDVAAGVRVDEVVPCTNTQDAPDRGPDRGFAIDGAELLAFARSFDGPRPARVVYHSHPNGRAYFSDTDRDLALGARYPVQHLVVGVTADGVTECAQFAVAGNDVVELARWPA